MQRREGTPLRSGNRECPSMEEMVWMTTIRREQEERRHQTEEIKKNRR